MNEGSSWQLQCLMWGCAGGLYAFDVHQLVKSCGERRPLTTNLLSRRAARVQEVGDVALVSSYSVWSQACTSPFLREHVSCQAVQ